MFGLIYILIDPRTRKIRYVGQTKLEPSEQLRALLEKPVRRRELAAWLSELKQIGERPVIVPIAKAASKAELDKLEEAFIAELSKGCDLAIPRAPAVADPAPQGETMGRRLLRAATAISSPTTRDRTPRAKRVAMIREMLRDAKPLAAILEWASNTYPAIPGVVEAKAWKVTKTEALALVNEARDMNALGDLQTTAVKRQERRAIYEHLLERALARNSVAGDILATKINDYMCRIDGAYDPSQLPPSTVMPLSIEDAIAAIDHATSTMELAKSRGALALPEGEVIDVQADEDELDDDDGASAGVSAN